MPDAPCSAEEVEVVVREEVAADGHPPLSEHKFRVLRGAAPGHHVCWGPAGGVDGVAVAAPHDRKDGSRHWAVEVGLRPASRSAEAERAAIERGTALAPSDATVTLWCHRDAQLAAAEALGFVTLRQILLMDRALPSPAPVAPPGYQLRTFSPGRDEDEVASINNAAFAGHRENDNMTSDYVVGIEAEPWFDPAGLLIAQRGGEPAGFCWTKVHPDGAGEIYILAVGPEHQHRGLGRWLVLAGLADLHDRRSANHAILWTDAGNGRALSLYEELGFTSRLVNREMALAQPNG